MSYRINIQSHSVEQTLALAAAIARELRGGDMVTLEGELGSGKTVFVRGLAEGMGIRPGAVSSPTFVIVQEYSAGDNALTLMHIDAYRLSGLEDLETIGWVELIGDSKAIIAIEWPSRIESALPSKRIAITISHVDSHTRSITITVPAESPVAKRLESIVKDQRESGSERASTKCRKCGKQVEQTAATFPFCSTRCKMADLGVWFNEGYRVSRTVEMDDELED